METKELMKYLTDDERQRYVKFEEVFESDGWRMIQEIAQARVTQVTLDLADITSWEEHRVLTGMRKVWQEVITMEESFQVQFEALAQERANEELDAALDADV